MFSQTTEYALRAAATLARDPEVPKTAQQISQATQVPAFYMSKILHDLGGAGLVHAQRGRHGGFILAHPPEQVSILDVVNAIAPLHRITRCPLGIPGHVRLCPLHRRIDDAIAHVEESFGRTSLAELLLEDPQSPPLCEAGKERPGGPRKKPGTRTGRTRSRRP